MLLQSYDGNIHLLPALPTAWTSGSIKGLKAIGDFTVDQEWDNKYFVSARIINNQGQPLTLTVGLMPKQKIIAATVNGAEVTVTTNEDGSYTIPTSTAGDIIELKVVDIPEPDAIKRPTAAISQADQNYTLNGVKVDSINNSGIYIVNGKKKAVK